MAGRQFIAQIGVVEEEADESAFGLEMILEGSLIAPSRLKALGVEASEITAIMAGSRKTAKS